MEDILRDDDSVRFYTGLPNLNSSSLNLTSSYAETMQYWDKLKKSTSYYQRSPSKKNPAERDN